jgi:hypothetical protein
VIPLNGADLVMALGARQRIEEMGHKAMAMPLFIWRHENAEDAAQNVVPHCLDFPWRDAQMNSPVFCSESSVRRALQRLSGSSGRVLSALDDQPSAQAMPQPWLQPRRSSGHVLAPLMEVLYPLASIVGMFGVVLALLCACSAMAPEDKYQGGRRRDAAMIRNERKMRRASAKAPRISTQKKID